MALYDYDLYLIRESNKGSILADLLKYPMIYIHDDANGVLDKDADFCFKESMFDNSLIKLAIYFDETMFRRYFEKNGKAFINWLKEFLEDYDILYAFISGGEGSDYYRDNHITAKDVYDQLPELLHDKTIKYVHPLMYFSKRLQFDLLAKAELPYFEVIDVDVKGWLLFCGNLDSNNSEINDMGRFYRECLNSIQNNFK